MKTITSSNMLFCDIVGYEIVKRYISKENEIKYFCLFYRSGIKEPQWSVSIKPERIKKFRKLLTDAWIDDIISIGGIMKVVSSDTEGEYTE